MRPLIITLDGPAGSGKSTVARRLAQRLGLEFLDTGAMYRGLTALCLDGGTNPATDSDGVIAIARESALRFDWSADPPRLFAGDRSGEHFGGRSGGRDLTDRLRDPDVTVSVSDVASIPEVRRILVDAQRRIGAEHPRLLTEGRDQGSVAFPNAQVKFYLDAQPGVRAARRAEQLRQAGKPADERQILEQILRRDQRDAHRTDGPLICPSDAIRVDTSGMTLDGVVDYLENEVRKRISLTPSPSPGIGRGLG